jgi:hypothetical protein
MSDPRVAGLVCEGHTDVPVLRAIIEELWPEVDVRCLQPELDETDRAKGPAGWSQVKRWCETYAGQLDEILEPDLGEKFDMLVVAMDLDVAIDAGIENPPKKLGVYESNRLRAKMKKWLTTHSRPNLPSAIVLSTPVMAIEAWIIAAVFPRETGPERLRDPALWLVDKKKLRASPSNRKPWKELHRYRDFAELVAQRLSRVRTTCAEAERTARAIADRRDQCRDGD